MAGHIVHIGTHRLVDTHALAGKGLLQLHVAEATQTAVLNSGIKQLGVGPVTLAVQRTAAALLSHHEDFVFLEIGGLEQHACAVAQLQILEAQRLVVALLDDFSGLGQVSDERLILHVVHIGGNIGLLGGIDSGHQAFLAGIDGAFLLLVQVQHHQVLAVGTDEIR